MFGNVAQTFTEIGPRGMMDYYNNSTLYEYSNTTYERYNSSDAYYNESSYEPTNATYGYMTPTDYNERISTLSLYADYVEQ